MIEETSALADKALEEYGQPAMTLTELRQAITERLRGVSLSDWLIQERQVSSVSSR